VAEGITGSEELRVTRPAGGWDKPLKLQCRGHKGVRRRMIYVRLPSGGRKGVGSPAESLWIPAEGVRE
jgi:hypothetical protein